MDKPLRQHIIELEARIERLSQEMMRNQKSRREVNNIEAELRIAQQALESYQKAVETEAQLQRN